MKGKKQGAIPSSDADSLQRVDHPFAARLSNLRSMQRTLSSLEGAKKQHTSGVGLRWGPAIVSGESSGWIRSGSGLIERIFSIAKKSLALKNH